jgi:hypothetical protein
MRVKWENNSPDGEKLQARAPDLYKMGSVIKKIAEKMKKQVR